MCAMLLVREAFVCDLMTMVTTYNNEPCLGISPNALHTIAVYCRT